MLVPIVDDGEPPRLLLTRRTEDLPTHPGQVAFPGGYVEPGDANPVQTALREAREEIGLFPEQVEVLGLLDDFPTHTGRVAVTPVVGRLRALPALVPCGDEVARVFTIPVHDLAQPQRWRTSEEERPRGRVSVHFFDHEGETLWGLSARIVLHLLALTPLGSSLPRPGAAPR